MSLAGCRSWLSPPLLAAVTFALALCAALGVGLLGAFVVRLGQDAACAAAPPGADALPGSGAAGGAGDGAGDGAADGAGDGAADGAGARGTSLSAVGAALSLSRPGATALVGATEYGGPGDPSSGTQGAYGDSLTAHPDSYAELGGGTVPTATALGGLPYLTPLRVSWNGHQAVALKRDIGLGGGQVGGLPRGIDLWWQFAAALGIPYERGRWSGVVRVQRLSVGGAGALVAGLPASAAGGGDAESCPSGFSGPVALVPGMRAQLLPDGLAAAPANAPAAVRGMIAAGNQIVGRPYQWGGGHGTPLSALASTYDCSSSVEHLLYGAGLVPATFDAGSGQLESWGLPGPGRWVTIYASADHVFIYVAGLRWDTHDAAGPGDGSAGIGWHPLVREAAGFVVRHPRGL